MSKSGLKSLHLEMGKIVYGPVLSRRFGWSLGINVLPLGKKTCSFDCVYCQLGRTDNPVFEPKHLKEYPKCDDIVLAIEDKLTSANLKIDVITFSGNGESTLHPELQDIIKKIRKKLDEGGLNIPITILTNSSQLCSSSVIDGLKLFDNVVAKLDTVDQDCFMALNRPVKEMKVREIVKSLIKLRNEIGNKLILQIMIIDSRMDNAVANYRGGRLTRLVNAIQEINPAHIQIYSLDRKPNDQHILQVNRFKLNQVAQAIALKLGKDRVHIY